MHDKTWTDIQRAWPEVAAQLPDAQGVYPVAFDDEGTLLVACDDDAAASWIENNPYLVANALSERIGYPAVSFVRPLIGDSAISYLMREVAALKQRVAALEGR